MWYCVQSKQHKAFYAKANLERIGFTTLLPAETITKPYYGVMRSRLVPLFGNYFFVQFDTNTDNWKRIIHQPGVQRILSSTPEHPTAIPEHSINTMLACMQPSNIPTTKQVIQPGTRVRIVKGPLARDDIIGYEPVGICQWTRGNRIALLIAMVNGDVEVTFNVDSLELA